MINSLKVGNKIVYKFSFNVQFELFAFDFNLSSVVELIS